jgi:GntR family transcriptional regulator, transcriptional repressor for pyruvate dehydrogenase complex
MAVSPAQLRQPKLAELVANVLRQRILDGELVDGQLLPNQDSFVSEFGVSRPSMREALRILEAEGLITVRRGNIGGAVVHRPQARHVAYTLALVLEARGVTLSDVGGALQLLEGTSAGLCARREDRAKAVVPVLREANERARASVEDWLEYVKATSDFHRALIEHSGNETINLLVGSLEATWLTHVRSWAESTTEAGSNPDLQYRLNGVDAHDRITDLIESGDVAGATALAESHFDPEQFYLTPADADRTIDSSTMRAGDTAEGPRFGV